MDDLILKEESDYKMNAKLMAGIFQKLTTKRFVSEIILTLLEHLAKQTESKVDDKLVQVCRKALLEETKKA